MSANPALIDGGRGKYFPAPFGGERILLERDGIRLEINNMRTSNGKWVDQGKLYLTNVRLVFVATKTDAKSGLKAFDFPLLYVMSPNFCQPILGANYLEGNCRPVQAGGNPTVSPPHKFKLYFRSGGVGTFLPMLFQSLDMAHKLNQQQATDAAANRPSFIQEWDAMVNQAFVDPSDPTKVFLTQPTELQQPAFQQQTDGPPPGYPSRDYHM